jgi:hypothetical protein
MLLTRNKGRRIAANIGKLPALRRMPSVLAVLRLTTISNFTTCCTFSTSIKKKGPDGPRGWRSLLRPAPLWCAAQGVNAAQFSQPYKLGRRRLSHLPSLRRIRTGMKVRNAQYALARLEKKGRIRRHMGGHGPRNSTQHELLRVQHIAPLEGSPRVQVDDARVQPGAAKGAIRIIKGAAGCTQTLRTLI